MSDTQTPSSSRSDFSGFIDALVEIMRSGVRPDVLEAQRVLLQRLANQGDVFPSRIPAPRNITEIGGYLNLLESAGREDIRMSAVASALGVAGPSPVAGFLADAVPVGFIDAANDRPAGPAQPSIPPMISIRADFYAPLQSVKTTLHALGCALPLRTHRPILPTNLPDSSKASLTGNPILEPLGRCLEVYPGTLLKDPATDPLSLARPASLPTEPFRLVARAVDDGEAVAEEDWIVLRASASSVVTDPPVAYRFQEIAPLMSAAGWMHPMPLMQPASLAQRGTLTQFQNLTGLVADETSLGEELALLYPPAAIARSALSAFTGWIWDGDSFVLP